MPESYIALEVHGRFVDGKRTDESLDDLSVARFEPNPDTDVPDFMALAHRLNRQLAQYRRISNICAASLLCLHKGIDELTVATADLAESSGELTL